MSVKTARSSHSRTQKILRWPAVTSMILISIRGSAEWFSRVAAAQRGHGATRIIPLAPAAFRVAGARHHLSARGDGTPARTHRAQG